MFATKCSFCQFDNVPGARFCAECGSPLHLKVCPGCGKVSDVTATTCEHCHAPFPRIDLTPPVTAAEKAAAPPPAAAHKSPPVKVSPIPAAPSANEVAPSGGMRAWPLIMVALVAGGLPLLWFNRASLPEPKTFTPPPVVSPTLQTPPTQPAAAPALAPTAAPVNPPAAVVAPAAAASTADAAVESQPSGKPVAEKAESKAGKKQVTTQRPAQRKPEQTSRECTEAVAALGLCDSKQAKR